MRTTRVVLLASLLVAMMVAIGQALAGIPNIELVTVTAFVSGYLLGPLFGALIGAVGMGAHSLLNVLGTVAPPIWAAQVACFALIGCLGGIVGPALARTPGRARAAILASLTGIWLVVVYQLAVNVASFFTFASGMNVWVYVWGGLAFAAIQIVWNAFVFGVALPPMLRVLARHRRELRVATKRELNG